MDNIIISYRKWNVSINTSNYVFIGKGRDTKFNLALGGVYKEGFYSTTLDGNASKDAFISFSCSVSKSLSIPYIPISFTATLNPSASVNFNEYYDTFVNRVLENLFARRTVVDIPKNIYLHDINSYFTADFEIVRFDSVNRSGNQLGCEFDFCFYSEFNATYSWRLVTKRIWF